MKWKFGIIIFIFGVLHTKAAKSVQFALLSLENLKNFTENFVILNEQFPNSNFTIDVENEILIQIRLILRDAAAKNNIILHDKNTIAQRNYHLQSVEINKVFQPIIDHIQSIDIIFNQIFLPALCHYESDSHKYQSYNISEDVDTNIFLKNPFNHLSQIRHTLFNTFVSDNSTLLEKLVNELNVAHANCSSDINHQLFLSQFYEHVMKAELQVMTITVSVYELLRARTGNDFEKIVYSIINNFIETWSSHLKIMKKHFKNLSTKFHNCFQITSEAFLSEVHIIDLLPIHVNYSSNKVVTKIGLKVTNTILTLYALEATILPYGEILEDADQQRFVFSNNINYWNPYIEDFESEYDENCHIVEDVTKNFWNEVRFLSTSVPQDCVVVGAKIEILHLHSKKKLIYLRLQHAKFDRIAGTIDPNSIAFTNLWTVDDLELARILINESTDGSFKKNIEIPDTDARGNEKINRLPRDFRVRMRQEQYINYRVDCDPLSPTPLRPLTALSFWKSNRQNKNIYYLSLKASLYDPSENIDVS